MSPYIQTEYVTARELEVDGKKYLAVEARDSSDQLKKMALAAALTGAALTYVTQMARDPAQRGGLNKGRLG